MRAGRVVVIQRAPYRLALDWRAQKEKIEPGGEASTGSWRRDLVERMVWSRFWGLSRQKSPQPRRFCERPPFEKLSWGRWEKSISHVARPRGMVNIDCAPWCRCSWSYLANLQRARMNPRAAALLGRPTGTAGFTIAQGLPEGSARRRSYPGSCSRERRLGEAARSSRYRCFGGGGFGFGTPVVSYAPRPMLTE